VAGNNYLLSVFHGSNQLGEPILRFCGADFHGEIIAIIYGYNKKSLQDGL
jgi:hypothetical protein